MYVIRCETKINSWNHLLRVWGIGYGLVYPCGSKEFKFSYLHPMG
jgi:hypothetical protein